MNVLVKNVNKTSDLKPPYPYTSWVEYWEGKSSVKLNEKTKRSCFANCGATCYKADFEGAHVQKVFDITHKMYIIPLCAKCNHRTDQFYVDDEFMVPAP